ncbi:SRPBCC family protein [Methyloligella sp. 2.7D]|uniref:SRPBCC family protein n=1 Tax=unclassified Methyloligella TaxID=2625955 RepID=UPI00157D999E|nr:SRPBCC family protein [Methyloligella sp. GL2]QKP77392.1 SRPBCC family protein [Methyloligella sp. GL2]
MPILRGALLAGAVLVATSSAAYAIDVKTRIEAPGLPDQVWAQIGAFCDIAKWHPAVTDCSEKKDGDDTVRTLTLGDGGKIVEELGDTDAHSYSYEILESPLPVKDYEAKLWVEKDDEPDRTVIYWTADFDAADGSTDKEAEKVITGIFKAGLKGIKENAIKAYDEREGIEYTAPEVHGKE